MPALHPQIVHFAVALVFAGVAFRLLSLTGRVPFASPAAATLVLLGTLASFGAVHTGVAAHGPVERIPGVRSAVVEHEEWGERTRNILVIVSLAELGALLLGRMQHSRATLASMVAAVAGLVGAGAMYETAEHGGALVYSYAGGPGIRTGSSEDVNRMYVAGVYHQALQDRKDGNDDQAMALIETIAARFPANLDLQLMQAEWSTDVKKDPELALRRLGELQIAPDNTRARVRAGLARASALSAQGNPDGARAVVDTLLGEFPDNAQVKRRLDEMNQRP